MNPEHRAGCESRVAGRTLSGVALRYGDISPDFQERFVPRAFGNVDRVAFNLQHDRSLIVAPEALLTDSPRELRVRADLPESSAALKLVRRGALNGFSIEFHSRAERREGAIRVVERADLAGLALVDRGAYPQSLAEIRARGDRSGRLGTLRGRIPAGRTLACECGPQGCLSAIFEEGALDSVLTKDEILATVGDFSRAFASKRREGLRFWKGADGTLEFAADIPPSEVGERLLEQMRSVDVYGRPSLNLTESSFRVEGSVARYTDASVRGLIIKPTDRIEGWTPLVLGEDGERTPRQRREAPVERRRVALWL